jgi:hypothetical protein
MTVSCDDQEEGYDKAVRLLKNALGWDNTEIVYNNDGVHIDVKNH